MSKMCMNIHLLFEDVRLKTFWPPLVVVVSRYRILADVEELK